MSVRRPLYINQRKIIWQGIMKKSAWNINSAKRCSFVMLLWFILLWIPYFLLLTRPTTDQSPSVISAKTTFPFDQGAKNLPKFSLRKKNPLWLLSKMSGAQDNCAGRYVYMHDIPKEFNLQMLDDCEKLSLWTDMCKSIVNAGLGERLNNTEGVFSKHGWFATNQFTLEVIFHNRMKQYSCLTIDSSKAAAIFVPFYAGIDVARHLWGANIATRDHTSMAMADWLHKQPEWKILGGRDHFMVAGRITWDFRRQTNDEKDWGNRLMLLPVALNMTMLAIEASPYHNNDFAIPYPTYFHPSRDVHIQEWQEKLRISDRTYLFSFAGATRSKIMSLGSTIRDQIINECRHSRRCMLLNCDKAVSKCYEPSALMSIFQQSVFCLQPCGDSFTRRSIFDSVLAGCIPVFFHVFSAYTQYNWHLPSDNSSYSVFISEDDIRNKTVSIESILLKFSAARIQMMREKLISLIPGIIYADPRARLETHEDAFDLTVRAVIDRIKHLRKKFP